MDKNYDDGLVHCHNWACGPEASEGAIKPQGAEAAAPTQLEHDSFDDGLVHSHDWARG